MWKRDGVREIEIEMEREKKSCLQKTENEAITSWTTRKVPKGYFPFVMSIMIHDQALTLPSHGRFFFLRTSLLGENIKKNVQKGLLTISNVYDFEIHNI